MVIWILYLLTDHTVNIFFCLPSQEREERSQAYWHSPAVLSGYLLQDDPKGILIQSDIFATIRNGCILPTGRTEHHVHETRSLYVFYKTKKRCVSTIISNLSETFCRAYSTLFPNNSTFYFSDMHFALLQNNLPMLKNNLFSFSHSFNMLWNIFLGGVAKW